MEQKVITLISDATKIEASRINATTNFVEDLKLDSLDIVELMMKMEDEFGVEIRGRCGVKNSTRRRFLLKKTRK